MKGTWNGYYTYNNQAAQEAIGHQMTYFKLKIKEINKDYFTGEVSDDLESGGSAGIGFIKGVINKRNVDFIKEMPINTIIDFDGKRREFDRKHPKIYYSGILSLDNKTIEGEWRFKFGFMFIGFLPIPVLPTKGKFEMRKQFIEEE
jgi:hypothetical protein